MDLSTRRSAAFSPTLIRTLSGLSSQLTESTPTPEDNMRVEALMAQQRAADRKPRSGRFSYKEANPVLLMVAQGCIPNTTPALVQLLLKHGANVCIARPKSTSIVKMVFRRDQVEVRNNVLELATQNCSADVLFLLAQYADDKAVNRALPVAIGLGDSLKTAILLAKGADASPYCKLFLQAVDSGPNEMVDALLREVRGACQDCRNRGLVQAAAVGSMAKANMLMDSGADLSFDHAAALLAAIQGGSEDIGVAIASRSDMKQHPLLLDTAAGRAYDNKQHRLLQACLKAGSKGPEVGRVLIEAVSSQQLDVVGTLIQHGVSAPCDVEKALLSAIDAGYLDAIQILLREQLPQNVLAAAVGRVVCLADVKIVHGIIDILLSAGLCGDLVADALIRVLSRPMPREDESNRLKVIQLLLAKGQADINACKGSAVVQAIGQGRVDILRMLLQHGPSVDTLGLALEATMQVATPDLRVATVKMIVEAGNVADNDSLQRVATAAASRSLALDVLQFIAQFTISPAAYVVGFISLTEKGDHWLSPKGLNLVQFFLDHDVSGSDVDRALCRAAVRYNRDAVELLATSVSHMALNQVLGVIVEASADWQLPSNLWLIHLLLEWGCKGEIVDRALIQAVSTYADGKGHDLEALVDTLLTVGAGADVNAQQGTALQTAASCGHVPVLKRLSSTGAGRLALTKAFHAAITSGVEESRALAVMDVLCSARDPTGKGLDARAVLPDGCSPIVACLSTWPQSTGLLKRLIQLGCDLESQLLVKWNTGEELVPVLIWALCQRAAQPMTLAVFEVLIDAYCDAVNYKTPTSGMTPLIVAVKQGRNDVVGKLLAANAETAERNHHGQTALFLASRYGDLASVQALISARSRTNDGSLHEAAKNLHCEVVEALIKAKHDTNYPSGLHEGRTALQELCHSCNVDQHTVKLENTIVALEKGKADVLMPFQGRNALFLALENPQPYPITKTLLEVLMWRYINHEQNIFVRQEPGTPTKHIYSATLYLAHLYRGNAAHIPVLHNLLREKRCEDRFYAVYGPRERAALQPPGAVGMPTKIAEEDERRWLEQEKRLNRDRDHMEKLQRSQQEADQKAEIEQRHFEQRVERAKVRKIRSSVDPQHPPSDIGYVA